MKKLFLFGIAIFTLGASVSVHANTVHNQRNDIHTNEGIDLHEQFVSFIESKGIDFSEFTKFTDEEKAVYKAEFLGVDVNELDADKPFFKEHKPHREIFKNTEETNVFLEEKGLTFEDLEEMTKEEILELKAEFLGVDVNELQEEHRNFAYKLLESDEVLEILDEKGLTVEDAYIFLEEKGLTVEDLENMKKNELLNLAAEFLDVNVFELLNIGRKIFTNDFE